MGVDIRLLGPPTISRDGVALRLAGRKPWALLAMLVLEPEATSRGDLIGRITPGANDPHAALRWLLHQVRRAVEPDARIVEERSRLRFVIDGDVSIDVVRVLALDNEPDTVVADVAGLLLEGIEFVDAPELGLWLSMERARVQGAAAEALWWAATKVAEVDTARAIRIVRRGLDMDPYCETKHELMIDLHLRGGDMRSAQLHAEAVERLYRDDLGIAAPAWILRPLDRRRRQPSGMRRSGATGATARALITSATARLAAGDEAGALDTARRGWQAAVDCGERAVEVAGLLTLSRAITQSGRAPAAEAKGLLTRAASLALAAADHAALADAQREVGVALLNEGNLGAADAVLGRSVDLSFRSGDERRAGQAMVYRGVIASHRAKVDGSLRLLEQARATFERLGDPAWVGYAEAFLARSLVQAGRAPDALRAARSSGARLRAAGWISALPWAMLAEADGAVAVGDAVTAGDRLAEVSALAIEIGNPTLEGLAARGRAGLRHSAGDLGDAIESLDDALSAVQRFGDGQAWATAAILTDLVALEQGRDAGHVEAAYDLVSAGPFVDLMQMLRPFLAPGRSQTLLQTASA